MAACYNCGTDFSGKYCPTCGAAAPVEQNAVAVQDYNANNNQNQNFSANQGYGAQNYGNQGYGNQGYTAPPPVYTQPVINTVTVPQAYSPTTALGWFGWMLLIMALPLIGPIIMYCAASDPSAKNFAKLQLIFWAIGAILGVISVLLLVLLPLIGVGLMNT